MRFGGVSAPWVEHEGPVILREYNSASMFDRLAFETDVGASVEAGWTIVGFTATSSRNPWGLLLGIIGFWLLKRSTVYHVLYVRAD